MFLVHRGTSLKKSYGTNTEQKEEELLKSVPLLLFFNAKSDEITEIFSAGKPIDNVQKVKETLESLAPLYFEKWQKIK